MLNCLEISWIHPGSCFGFNHNITKYFQKVPQNEQILNKF